MFLETLSLDARYHGKERRAHPRHVIYEHGELIIPAENMILPCRVVNISDGGAGIICDIVPGVATTVRLVMKDGRVFDAITAWFEDGELGLRFVTG